MSMLSAQADELRELARHIDRLQSGAVRAVTMPSNMGVTLRDAADTIASLRDRAQDLQAENAKLRELAARMARALGVGRWCNADCGREFGCDWTPEGCPVANAMRELGVGE